MTIELIKPIPARVVNEGASFWPLNLSEFVRSSDQSSLSFQAELSTGEALPAGLICTSTGSLTGIPAKGTQGSYEIVISAHDDSGQAFSTQFKLTIKSRIIIESADLFAELKQNVWEAIGDDLPIPDIGEFIDRPVTEADIQYLLQRFATFIVWNVYDLAEPGEKNLVTIPGCSSHFNVYDRGCCLVGVPKELFSHERTLEDALQTARAMAGEAYERSWVVEFSGFQKMSRAAWIELQLLSDKFGRKAEVLHYNPSSEDLKIYAAKSKTTPSPKF